MLEQKEAIESDTSLSAAAKSAAIAAITYDGSSVDSLYLDFTCPGHPEVELCEGGAEKAVTMENLGEYIDAVVDATLGSGVHAQVLALRAGFEDTVPLSAVVRRPHTHPHPHPHTQQQHLQPLPLPRLRPQSTRRSQRSR